VPGAVWVWRSQQADPAKRVVTFTKSFLVSSTAAAKPAVLQLAVDNQADLSLNGQPVASSGSYASPSVVGVSLRAGTNTVSVTVTNIDNGGSAQDNPAGVAWSISGGAGLSVSQLFGAFNELMNYRPCHCGDPVENATGNLTEEVSDLTVSARSAAGFPLATTRTYNSLRANKKGRFGYGWSDNYGWSLAEDATTGVVNVVEGTGATASFYPDGSGGYATDSAVLASLEKLPGGGWRLVRAPHQTYTFDGTGRLLTLSKMGGAATSLSYTGALLTSVSDPNGRSVTYTYNAAGLVISATGPGARMVSYRYNAAGNLTTVTDVTGAVTSMTYDTSHRLLTVTDPRSQTMTVTYDAQGRVATQAVPGGGTMTWAYTTGTDGSSSTVVTDALGHQATFRFLNNILVSQTRGSGTAQAATTSYTYDASLQPSSVTDPEGHLTTFTYDTSGNVLTRTDAKNQQVSYAYNPAGDRTSMTTVDGTTRYGRDGNGLLTSVSDPLDHTTSYTYTPAGEVATATTPANRTTSYGYDTAGNRTSVTSPAGEVTSYGYDASGWVTSKTDPRGNVTGATAETYTSHYIYDPAGRVTKWGNQVDTVTATSYDGNGNPTAVTVTGAAGKVFSDQAISYDAGNRPVATTNVGRPVRTNTYDPVGNLLTSTDGTGATTSYTYDPLDRVVTMTTARGNQPGASAADYTWTYGYDRDGNQTTSTDPQGRTTTAGYDALNRPTTRTTPKGYTTSTGYDPLDRVTTVTDPLGRVTGYGYDTAGRQTSITAPGLAATTLGYDPDGLVTSRVSPSGKSRTSYTYDADGRPATRVDPLGNTTGATPGSYTTSYGYNPNGDLTSVKDQLGRTTTTSYDPASHPLKVTTPGGSVTTRTYNGVGQVTSVKDPVGATTSYTYDTYDDLVTRTDALGQPTSYTYTPNHQVETITDPLNRTRSYGYDTEGHPTTEVTARGTTDPNTTAGTAGTAGTAATWTIHQTYDARGLRTAVSNTADPDVNASYGYDDDGRMTSFQDTTGTTTLAYDTADQLGTVTGPDGTYSYTYAPFGAVAKRTLPTGGAIDYTFDTDGRIDSETANTYKSVYGYDANDQLTTATYPTGTGLVETRRYDPTGNLTQVVNKKASTVLSQFDYTLDTDDNPTTIKTTRGTTATSNAYTYDAAHRLKTYCPGATSCTGAPATDAYTYDLLGNRTQEVRTGLPTPGTITHSYDAAGQRTSTTDTTGARTDYTYDADGHLTTGGRTWDVLGRMTSTNTGTGNGTGTGTGTGTPTTIKYNALGLRRTLTTGTGPATSYSWDLNNPMPMLGVLTRPDATTWTHRYDPTGWAETIVATGQNYTYSYLMHDNQGSITDVAGTTNGTPQWSYTYDPFGARTGTALTSTAFDVRTGYTSAYLEPALGEYHLRARDYNPIDAQFHAPDPLTPPTGTPYTSPYLYANNQPTVLTDPTGLFSLKGVLIGAGVAAAAAATTACIIAEPCGIIEGGVALGVGAESAAALGASTLGGATVAESALTAGLAGATTDMSLQTGISLATGNGVPSPCQNLKTGAYGFAGGLTGYGLANNLRTTTTLTHTLETQTTARSVGEIATVDFRSDTAHIFRNATGHLAEDTAENRMLIRSALDPSHLRDTITLKDGSTLEKYFRTMPDGTQAWAEVRNGEITNGGLNVIPR
jgi:RHS repeat-associated protein